MYKKYILKKQFARDFWFRMTRLCGRSLRDNRQKTFPYKFVIGNDYYTAVHNIGINVPYHFS